MGGAAGWVSALVYQTLKMRVALDVSLAAMAAHAVGWSLLAIVIAVTVWLATRGSGVSVLRLASAAVAGAIVATLLYPVITAVAFPMNNSDLVIPSGHWNRLVWIECNSLLIALGVLLGMTPREPLTHSLLGSLHGDARTEQPATVE